MDTIKLIAMLLAFSVVDSMFPYMRDMPKYCVVTGPLLGVIAAIAVYFYF